jgi:hypothetical protein
MRNFVAGALVLSAYLIGLPNMDRLLAGNGALQIRNSYFWDPIKLEYFIPRGLAYQSWNPPVGANQSFEQLDYDLLEFKKIYANSVRCEFVWGEVQTGPAAWDWSKPDHLVEQAEKLGLKLFVIIGFQYPPKWFPPEWRNINEQGLTAEVLDCLASNKTQKVTNCLPSTILDCLYTNAYPTEIIDLGLHCLTSNIPTEVIGCLKASLPQEFQTGQSNILSCFISDVINYEHPDARRAYTNHIAEVGKRYKDSRAIGAWIMGNEYAYFDLWESPTLYKAHRFIGYDPLSLAAFRGYLKTLYGGDIQRLNANWRTSYADFESVQMPRNFPADRDAPSFYDLIQWRQQSIGGFIASGALTAKTFDPNHLLTYSMVGGIFNGNDANNTCEDARAIVSACENAGAPLNFWSINNYAHAAIDDELRSADYGIAKYQQQAGLPVMISETGHSSTEDLPGYEGAAMRQPKALPSQVWESLLSGAIGTHIFHWSDRSQFTRGYFLRERGFGIVEQTRRIKSPVYENVVAMFRRMEDIRIDHLLGGSTNPRADIQFFWSRESDLVWPSANEENSVLWGALKRLGYQPGIIDERQFALGDYTNAQALLLSRCFALAPQHLDDLATKVLGAGIHVHANADLPGQFNAYHKTNANWIARMNALFGLDVTGAVPGWDSSVTNKVQQPVPLNGVSTLGPVLNPNYSAVPQTWKVWHGLKAISGTTVVSHRGVFGAQPLPAMPALQIKTGDRAKTAINTFGLGNITGGLQPGSLWDLRYDWLRAIYRTHFGIKPAIELTGANASYVIPDYRICANGSILIALLNEHTNSARITLSAPSLILGKTVENLTAGGIIESDSDGIIELSMAGDDYVLLYAYNSSRQTDESLVNSNPNKIWFESAPMAVWPNGAPYDVTVGYDTREPDLKLAVTLERAGTVRKIYGRSPAVAITGLAASTVQVPVPDPDLNDPDYISSPEGGLYIFHALMERDGVPISDTALPVRLLWGVRPLVLPTEVVPLGSYKVPVEWQELRSYDLNDPTPLDRAALWESSAAKTKYYDVVLELRDVRGQVVAAATNITTQGTDQQLFNITVPQSAQGPFSWSAALLSAPATGSHDVCDSFEGRDNGSDLAAFYPWFGYKYPSDGVEILSSGVLKEVVGKEENQVAYLVVKNPPNPGPFSGFGLVMGIEPVWALPANRKLWTNYVFSFDFKEKHRFFHIQSFDHFDYFVEPVCLQIKIDQYFTIGKFQCLLQRRDLERSLLAFINNMKFLKLLPCQFLGISFPIRCAVHGPVVHKKWDSIL